MYLSKVLKTYTKTEKRVFLEIKDPVQFGNKTAAQIAQEEAERLAHEQKLLQQEEERVKAEKMSQAEDRRKVDAEMQFQKIEDNRLQVKEEYVRLEIAQKQLEEERRLNQEQTESIAADRDRLADDRRRWDEERENLTAQAREEASATGAAAEVDAKHIQEEAQVKAEAIVTAAEGKQFEIKEHAHRLGHEEGFEEGKRKGIETGRGELDVLGRNLQDITVELNNRREEILQRAEPRVVDLVLAIAHKVVYTEIAENRDLIQELVREAIRRLKTKEQIIVRINPDDLKSLKEYKNDLLMIFSEIEDLDIREDRNVTRGGCMVETEASQVDARIETRFGAVEREINRLK